MGPSRPRLRLSAILSADVRGFSRLMERDEVGTHRRLVESRRLIDGAIDRHGGRLVGSAGDSVLAEFSSVVEAITAAVEAQQSLAQSNAELRPEQRLEFRIGINLGEVIVDGDDIFGDGVNIAARLQALAEPGGVWISGRVHDQVQTKLPYPCRSRGSHRVKNITRPLRIYSVDWGGRSPVASVRPRRWRLLTTGLALALLGLVGLYQQGPQVLLVDPASWFGAPETSLEAISEKPTVAVLPFKNRNGSERYFSEGVSEDVIAALARFSGLAVLSASATAPFKDDMATPAEIHRALGARYLVRGIVWRDGERVRVAAELTDAERGVVLWSERFDEEGTDLFALQNEIARDVAAALVPRVDRAERERASAKPTDSLRAYDLVLRGRELLKQRTFASNLKARQLFERAIERDPEFAMAYEELAEAHRSTALYGWTEFPLDSLQKAEELAQKALALDPESANAHRILAQIFLRRGQYAAAIEQSERAIDLNPSDGASYATRAEALGYAGQIDKAITSFETALQFVAELSLGDSAVLAICYYLQKRYDDAIRVLNALTSRDPDFAYGHVVLAAAHAQAGHPHAAEREAEIVRKLAPFFRISQFGSVFRMPEQRARLTEGLRKAGLPE